MKTHEQMIGEEDAPTFEYQDHYKILPMIHEFYKDPLRIKNGIRVPEDFSYRSDNNNSWMSINELHQWINKYLNEIH